MSKSNTLVRLDLQPSQSEYTDLQSDYITNKQDVWSDGMWKQ